MRLLKFFILIVCIASCSEKPLEEGKYRINGTVTGLDHGEIYLQNYPSADTIKVKDGKFTIERSLQEVVARISITKDANDRVMNEKKTIYFFVEPTIMKLSLNYDDFSQSKLQGSKTQDEQYSPDSQMAEVTKKYAHLQEAYKKIRKELDDSYQTASEEELEKMKDAEYKAKGKLSPMYKETEQLTLEFIKKNPHSYISLFNLRFALRDLKYHEAKPIVDAFPQNIMNTRTGKEIEKELEEMKKGVPGAIAGNFDTTDINGKPIKLADFKGKYLLIDFWASWCVPCRKGSPHLIELHHKYHSKGLEVLGVASDDNNHPAWRKAVKKDKVGIWHHMLSGKQFDRKTMKVTQQGIGDHYNISTLPTKILVGPDGVIVGRYGSGGGNDADMDRDLAKIFGE